jgi:hypothetical protein
MSGICLRVQARAAPVGFSRQAQNPPPSGGGGSAGTIHPRVSDGEETPCLQTKTSAGFPDDEGILEGRGMRNGK